MSDAKYFQTTSKGEIAELKDELHHKDRLRKKEAVKKVIAAMTVGKDVSVLFADVINLMQTNDVELKKLVYLYLMNYAKSQPDLAILAVNTFVNDARDPNPLIRALAVRTMGCIRVDKITEYLCEPLGQCLKDSDPYVRKTAAVCVAKLHDINAELVEDKGFIDTLKDMLADANPMVVANTVAALSEIAEASGSNTVLPISTSNLQKLQAALNECTEWGQVFILDALAKYRPQTSREAEAVVERVLPRLNHANSAVVLSAVKICIKFMDKIDNADFTRVLLRKLAPSLVTLLSREPEVQYVALRNINLVVQLKPAILQHEIKVFYCKYNDPVYVKLEKLEIMIRLASERNIDQVLMEFKEYATEVDVDFVRRSVRAIGRCAVKLEKAAERCINVLLGLIQTKVNYVVQEAIVVIKDIFRRYPDRYESIIGTLCESLERLDEPEAKASMIWIIGEYAGRIDNADELLDTFLETFNDEPAEVQLQLLTATVKLFLKKPGDAQEMVQRVLTTATQNSDNPDLRDRGYLYWRLLSTDPEAAKRVVLADKPVITDGSDTLPRAHLLELIANMSTLSSVFHKSPEAFVVRLRGRVREPVEDDDDEDVHVGTGGDGGGGDDEDDATPAEQGGAAPVVDLLDLGLGDTAGGGSGGGGGEDIDASNNGSSSLIDFDPLSTSGRQNPVSVSQIVGHEVSFDRIDSPVVRAASDQLDLLALGGSAPSPITAGGATESGGGGRSRKHRHHKDKSGGGKDEGSSSRRHHHRSSRSSGGALVTPVQASYEELVTLLTKSPFTFHSAATSVCPAGPSGDDTAALTGALTNCTGAGLALVQRTAGGAALYGKTPDGKGHACAIVKVVGAGNVSIEIKATDPELAAAIAQRISK
eukprot:TRINITY_DN423_c3_g1_i1.p1 TRINITY_DN423_c3_g1~~TRINITY_DN423_c3_g1_i1.p1  ORF type:complete len:925 (-),score=596.37 TRINITY_DN423_c3_g1_i1:43-2673(-)